MMFLAPDSQVLKLVAMVMMGLIVWTNACGTENGRACCIHERNFCTRTKKVWGVNVCTGWGSRGACGHGLTETSGCRGHCGCSSSMCRRITACGNTNQRACCATERIPSCYGDLIEKLDGCHGNNCYCANTGGFLKSAGHCRARDCGRENQRACCVHERPGNSCDGGLTETIGCSNCGGCSSGTCRRITSCGGNNQRACCANENNAIPCKGDLIQKAGCSGNDCWCTGGVAKSAGKCKNRDCGRRGQRACCLLERPKPCDDGLINVPGCSNCGCSISQCLAAEDIAGNVAGFVGEINAAHQAVSNLVTSVPTEISNLKNWITTEYNSKVKTKLDQAVIIAERLHNEIKRIPERLETKANEIKSTIQTTFDQLKPRVLSIAEIVEDETLKSLSKIQLFFDETTTIDTDLMECIESFTPEVTKFFVKAVTLGGDVVVKKILTEILRPNACVLCSSKFSAEARQRFNCPNEQRRLSDDLWHAINIYGPEKKLNGEDMDQATEKNDEVKNKFSLERKLKSSPVTNNLGTCPHAPEVSAKPAYSDTGHHAYSEAMRPLQLLSIVNPSDDNDDKWDTRTDQNLVAAVLMAELALNTIFEFHEKICEAIPEQICYSFCATNTAQALCWSMTAIGAAFRAFFASILASVALHDGVVDGAEIEATLVNTEKLVNWTCAIEKHVSEVFQTIVPPEISFSEVTQRSIERSSKPNPSESRAWVSEIEGKVDLLHSSIIAEIGDITNQFRHFKTRMHRKLLKKPNTVRKLLG